MSGVFCNLNVKDGVNFICFQFLRRGVALKKDKLLYDDDKFKEVG